MTTGITGKAITGAGSGLGAAACHWPRNGAKLVLGARRIDRLPPLASELFLGDGCAVCMDVTKRAEAIALVERATPGYSWADPAACRQDALFRAVATHTAPTVARAFVMFMPWRPRTHPALAALRPSPSGSPQRARSYAVDAQCSEAGERHRPRSVIYRDERCFPRVGRCRCPVSVRWAATAAIQQCDR